uniref:50S ribosomal protein L17 n=1 Tax=Spongospora subterranea TaxID=70186 RepID=A0A0H5R7X2_9EUKA|eukprot:CRZ10275.1 hypothetical protein [Spongospora subterranea]
MPTIAKLGLKASHRWSMMKTMVTQLITYERIETTLVKAKELRKVADRCVTFAKRGGRHDRVQAGRVVEQPEALEKLWQVLGPRYTQRQGGYTRVLRSRKRFGDNATLAFIEFVDRPGELRQARPPSGETTDAVGSAVPCPIPSPDPSIS